MMDLEIEMVRHKKKSFLVKCSIFLFLLNTTFKCMVEKVCEPQRTSPRADWSQKPATLGSNQGVEIGGVGYSWSVLLKKRQLSLLFWRSLMWTMPKSPQKTYILSTYMKLKRVRVALALKAPMSMVRQIVYQWKFSVVTTAPRLGHPVKTAARALSRRSAEDSQKSLAHAHTFEKSTSKTFRKNGVSRWAPQRKPQKKNIAPCLKLVCTWMSRSITATTDGTIHFHVHRDILQENQKHIKLRSTQDGCCNRTLTRRQKATTEMLQQKKKAPFGVAQSPDLEMLWCCVRSAKHSGPPEKINEPKQFCKEERYEIPSDRETGLIWLRSALPKQSQLVYEIQNFNKFSTLYLKTYRLCLIKT